MTVPVEANPYAEARTRLAVALAGLPWPVHAVPPESIAPPCVVVYPASTGWIGKRGYVGLLARCVAAGTGPGLPSLSRLEDMVHRTRLELRRQGLGPGETDGPAVSGDRLTADVPVTVRTAAI